MGRTPTPLTIWVHPPWADQSEVRGLAAKGHTIIVMDTAMGFDPPPDLILHPSAHRWTEAFWDEPTYLAAALKRARAAKKGGLDG